MPLLTKLCIRQKRREETRFVLFDQLLYTKEVMAKGVPHYLPSGRLYTGKTHKHNGKLMSGGTHTATSKVLSHKKPKGK